MTDRGAKRQQKRIRCYIDRWKPALFLDAWTLHLEYDRRPAKRDKGGWRTICRTFVQWPYLSALLTWNLSAVAETPDDVLEELVVHELCHVLIAQAIPHNAIQVEAERQNEERVVQQMAQAYLQVRRRAARLR